MSFNLRTKVFEILSVWQSERLSFKRELAVLCSARVIGLFWPLFDSKIGEMHTSFDIDSSIFGSKISSKEPKTRQTSGFRTASREANQKLKTLSQVSHLGMNLKIGEHICAINLFL